MLLVACKFANGMAKDVARPSEASSGLERGADQEGCRMHAAASKGNNSRGGGGRIELTRQVGGQTLEG